MNSMFKLQLAYDEAKSALEMREKALLSNKAAEAEPVKSLAQMT